MPKVLRIINRLNIGGPTYNVAYLSRYMPEDYSTLVLSGNREQHEGNSDFILTGLGVPFEYVPGMYRSISPANDRAAYRFIRQKISSFHPDIVHTHAAKAGALGRLAASASKVNAIVHTYHGNVFDGYFSPLKTKLFIEIERYLCRKSHAVVAISESQKKDLVEKYRIVPEKKVHVIPLGFDLSRFATGREEKRKLFRDAYHIDDDTVVVTITGRLTGVKDHRLFLESFNYLRTHSAVKVKAFVVGDGELMEDLKVLVTELGMQFALPGENKPGADVFFTSWRQDIDVINAGSDIISLTSLNEGTPVSLIEGLASGKAVISTDVGGVKDIFENGRSGILAGHNAEEYGSALVALAEDSAAGQLLAGNGEKNVVDKFSYMRLVRDMTKLYEGLL